jgi:hypothetical protein
MRLISPYIDMLETLALMVIGVCFAVVILYVVVLLLQMIDARKRRPM